jgi:hypothetical protein
MLSILATSAPFAVIQMFFAILVIFFFLSAGLGCARRRSRPGRASMVR